MAWVATATVGVGLLSYVGGRQTSKDADSRSDAANAVSREQLEFQKDVYTDESALRLLDRERFDERYDKLESIFGPIEDNLGNFYNSLTPETFAAAGLENQAQQFNVAKQQFTTALAQKRIGTSGTAAAGIKDMAMENAKANATIRRDAPFKVAEAKQGFLATRGNVGAPPGPVDTSGVSNASANFANNLTNQSITDANNASSMYQSAGNLLMTGAQYAAQNYQGGANQGGTAPMSSEYINPSMASINPSTGREWGA